MDTEELIASVLEYSRKYSGSKRRSHWEEPECRKELAGFVERIIQGNYALMDNKFVDFMEENLKKENVLGKIKRHHTNQKLVDVVSQTFPYETLQALLEPLQLFLAKDELVAKELSNEGDDYMKSKDLDQALRCYTLALKFATEDATFVRLFLKRHEVFKTNDEHELAVNEIARAQEYTFPIGLKTELVAKKRGLQRLIPAEVRSDQFLLGEELKDKILSQAVELGTDKVSLPKSISVRKSQEKGRYLTARKVMRPGTAVFIETPFVHVSVGQLTWQTDTCDRCLCRTMNPIPCETCVIFSYCSEECRLEDQTHGHRFECPILGFLHMLRMSGNAHMAVKAICKAGPHTLYELFNKFKNSNDAKDFWVVPKDQIHKEMDAYSRVLNVASHDIFSNATAITTWMSIAMASALRLYTSFFDNCPKEEVSEFENFVASIILHHFKSFTYNTASISYVKGDNPILDDFSKRWDAKDKFEIQVGSGIYPVFSLMNHSCVPSTGRAHFSGTKMCVFTTQRLQIGNELTHSYGPHFAVNDLSERQEIVKVRFRFVCDCMACCYNWPTLKELIVPDKWFSNVHFHCPECKKVPRRPDEQCPILTFISNSWAKCKTCEETFSMTKDWTNFIALCNKQAKANNMLRRHRPVGAIQDLVACIDEYKKTVAEPCHQLIRAQVVLLDSLDLLLQGKLNRGEPLHESAIKMEDENMVLPDTPVNSDEPEESAFRGQKSRCTIV